MKIGLSAAAYYSHMETEEQAAYIAQNMPIDVCEIFLETHCEYNRAFGELVRKNLGDMPCFSVHPKGTQFEPDLFGRSLHQEADAFAAFEGVLDAGQAIGAKYYVMHGPAGVHKPVQVRAIYELQPRFARMQELARQRGMEVLLENVCWAMMHDLEQLRVVRELLPEMNFVLDIKQAYRGHTSPFDVLTGMEDHVRHVHLLDWQEDGTLCLPGEGTFDFLRLIRQLRDQGFPEDSCLIIEPYEHMARDPQRVIRSLAFLRETVQKA